MPTRLCILQLGRFPSPALDGSSIFPRDSMGFEARAGETERASSRSSSSVAAPRSISPKSYLAAAHLRRGRRTSSPIAIFFAIVVRSDAPSVIEIPNYGPDSADFTDASSFSAARDSTLSFESRCLRTTRRFYRRTSRSSINRPSRISIVIVDILPILVLHGRFSMNRR